jgi:hypothetical protein
VSRPPAGLKTSGKALWASVTADFTLDEHDSLVLKEACRCADRLDALTAEAEKHGLTSTNKLGTLIASPLLGEARQQQIVLTRLIASLRLPVGEESSGQRRSVRGAYSPRGNVVAFRGA